MAPTSTPLPDQQQAFTFTSPVSSGTHEDALDFDYESWVQQSKIANYYSNLWPEDAEAQAINRHHREMMLQAMDNLPEEAYELSLRDLSELSLSSRATTTTTDGSASNSSLRFSARSPSNTKLRRKKNLSMEGAGFIIKLFMPSPSRAAGGGRKKSFSSSTVSVNDSMDNSASGTRIDPTCTRSHSIRNSHHDTTNRKPMACYPFFKSSKHRVKREAVGRLCI
ncbi:unnamed protein product [Urochloa decumbens]|uniref:Uncharacterized protein n=1 Tax=Urochloa decumbens TaxID=240449 RepID=A0ABC8YSH0_9POAL